MTTAVTHIHSVEGEVLDGTQFTNLYRLLDLERSASEEWQRLSMPAAFEVLAAFESNEWREDKQAEHAAEIASTNRQPSWSPTSERSFVKWLEARARRDGHEPRTLSTVKRLMYAANCVRIIESNKVIPAGITLPQTEDAWRPVYKMLTHGYRNQIGTVIERAAEIAEGEGKPITQGIMSKVAAEVWNSDPQIRAWVEQPGQTVDPRSAHDRVVTALNHIRKEANDLRKELGDNPKAWNEFLAGLAEIQ